LAAVRKKKRHLLKQRQRQPRRQLKPRRHRQLQSQVAMYQAQRSVFQASLLIQLHLPLKQPQLQLNNI
jgi:hypothetical protein